MLGMTKLRKVGRVLNIKEIPLYNSLSGLVLPS